MHVNLSLKNNNTPLEDGKECTREENCRDGEYYQADLLNCPDAVIKVVGSRRNLGTYKGPKNFIKEHLDSVANRTVDF